MQSHESNEVIVFVGTVGSGKSTQMRLLSSVMRKNGLKIKTTSLKTNHILARLLVALLIYFLNERKKNVYAIRTLIESRPDLFKSIFKFWFFLDITSITFKFLFTVLLPLKFGYTILAEEYIPAAICDYMYISKTLGIHEKTAARGMSFLLRLMLAGGSTRIVFLDARQDDLQFRWKTRGSPVETPDYLLAQRSVLLPLSKKLSNHEVLLIETSGRRVAETHDFLVSHFLNGHLKRRPLVVMEQDIPIRF